MSIKDAFYEILEAKYGIKKEEIEGYKIGKEEVSVIFKDGKRKKIKDPSLIYHAKLSAFDLNEYHRETLIKRIWGIYKVYENLDCDYEIFKNKLKNKTIKELKKELMREEEKIDKNYKVYLSIKIEHALLEMGKGIPTGFDSLLEKEPTEKLIDLLIEIKG